MLLITCCGLLFCSSGATCIHGKRTKLSEFKPPIIFEAPPSLHQIAEVVNRTQRVYQLQAPAMTVRSPGIPSLATNFQWRRDRDFRMECSVTRLTGVELEIGSNSQIFWMTSRRDVTPTIYLARHDQFESQLNRQILPVSPLWIMEGLGVIAIDINNVTEPPQIGADGLLRVNSIVPSPVGNYYRTLSIDSKDGTVREVLLRDPSGRLLAKAQLSEHQYYAALETSLPHKSLIEFMPAGGEQMSLQVEVGFYRINEEAEIDPSAFMNPSFDGKQVVDLVSLNAGANPMIATQGYQPAQQPSPQYRGVP